MKKLSIITALLLCACVQTGQAHEGHDHATQPHEILNEDHPAALNQTAFPSQTVRQIEGRRLLNAGEGKQFDALFRKPVRTSEETKVLDNLAQTGMQRLTEYLRLATKATRTDAETARMKELDALAAANEAVVKRLQEESALNNARSAAPASDESMRQLFATLIEQNKRIIAQNEQIIALLTQRTPPAATTVPAPPAVRPNNQ